MQREEPNIIKARNSRLPQARDIKQIYCIHTRNLFLKTNFPGMFYDDKCVNMNCQEKDTQFHLFYSDCFKEGFSIVKNRIDYNDIFSNCVSQQKIVKDIMIDRYQRRLSILSPKGRSK